MATAETIETEITQYLHRLSTRQKEVVLSVIKTIAGEEEVNEDYIAEMDKRFADLENGEVKGYMLDEMETGTRTAYQIKKSVAE